MTQSDSSGSPITEQQFPRIFAARDPQGHKGSFGSVAILGGSSGMTGAIILAGRAALKSGVGKTYLAVTQTPSPVAYDPLNPELMLHDAHTLIEQAATMDAWVAGCGLGQTPAALDLLKQLLRTRAARPLVLDADALNALARGDITASWGPGVVVLTPHPTEASRLLQTDTHSVQADRSNAAQTLARRYNAWVVLKGAGTIVCAPDGHWQVNTTGNVGLATGGTGDVLSGLLGSLLAQGIPAEQAITGSVWLHGAAADMLVSEGCGPIGLTAGELPDAIRKLRNRVSFQQNQK
ncbi:NAD(P)H-hydrate dehydratase [Zwartia vadi]|uniref:NAD(P)H-hydrate dehydratase n=1 Tax=Zwartia vadi TaxID=3058168 RepID=UPI0025B5E324|nr:NAD(P)H-hydrate dehydratase [Zwartia vadi]MDN3986255.1 NAD(P)H-hydrate dehydratase [Zwartia vadi]